MTPKKLHVCEKTWTSHLKCAVLKSYKMTPKKSHVCEKKMSGKNSVLKRKILMFVILKNN